ncbi:hypothetical protein [Bacillus sp. FJAT-28004]|uniref:hypothetical protein n=1 Tax=Bacillus sp. FJAT-28004 TaxID=1679165 RepID=UPI0006B59DCD|nr:hypothetical protein [Bacillus sp. FJAT-28004]
MIRNQSYMPQSAVMPEYFQQMQTSPNQANLGPQTANAETAPPQYHCCVDLSQMHHYPHMHDFHHMHHPHHMMDDFHPMMEDFHHMHHFHPMMDDFHHMHHDHHMMDEMWDEHMHYDHHHYHDGWEHMTLDYHHAWFHPMMHHHPHHVCFPVTCQPAGEQLQKAAVEKPYG